MEKDKTRKLVGDDSLRKKQKIVYQNEAGNLEIMLNKRPTEAPVYYSLVQDPNRKVTRRKSTDQPNVANIKIKTLAEIRAEKRAKFLNELHMEENDQEVTSTCTDENLEEIHRDKSDEHKNISPRRKIKLRRQVPDSGNVRSKREEAVCSVDDSKKDQDDVLLEQFDNESISGKTIDEGLLLESDEDDDDVTMKAEEELLNDIDDYFND